jgi:hypothetical protein
VLEIAEREADAASVTCGHISQGVPERGGDSSVSAVLSCLGCDLGTVPVCRSEWVRTPRHTG